MTSKLPFAYPADYYYPQFVDNRPIEDSNPSPPPLSTAITTSTDHHRLVTKRTKSPSNTIGFDVKTNQGLPEVDLTQAAKTDPKKNLIRDPAERNIPKLIVDQSIIRQSTQPPVIPVTNLDDIQTIESKPVANGHPPRSSFSRPKSIELRRKSSQRSVKFADEVRSTDGHSKKDRHGEDQNVVTVEVPRHDEKTYEGPFGLSRSNSLIFYITFGIITVLAAAFLIITGVFYSQGYPDSSASTGLIVGMAICGFLFYAGLLLILIGIWYQKYRYENPVKKIPRKSIAPDESTDYLKSSMEQNESYDYSYQQPTDYGPYGGYYSYPPYVSNVNEQTLLQQPGETTGVGYYDGVVWPTNVQVETQPDPKFYQPMEWTIGSPQSSKMAESALSRTQTPISSIIKKSPRKAVKPVEAEPTVGEFDSIQLDSKVIEQPLPTLSKAPETNELIQSLAKIPPVTNTTPSNSEVGTRKTDQVESAATLTDASSSDSERKHSKHRHHRRRRHHHHHHRRHDHHHGHSSYSPCPECEYYSRMSRRPPSPPVYVPRVLTPRFPRIVTPTASKISATLYRETAVNTGNETKIVRDSSTTANFEDPSNKGESRFSQIPVVRRTIIVEPYPSQPSTQIIVKPQENLIGKISLSKDPVLHNENERIVYPSTNFLSKKSKQKKKKKKKSTMVNDNVIEDLELEEVHDDDDNFDFNLKTKHSQISTRRTVRNAFYN